MQTPPKSETSNRAGSRTTRRSRLAVGFAAAGLLGSVLSGVTPANAQGATGTTNPAGIVVGPPDWARGNQAVAALGDRLPAVARAYGFQANQLRNMFIFDDTLVVDGNDELLYTDHAPADENITVGADGEPGGTAAAPPTTDPVFDLESFPGAAHTVYLDFDGHVSVGTSWLSGGEIVSPPYDIDGDENTFNDTELARIRATWEAVAEDFAPFEINVTTREPAPDALSRVDSSDSSWGTRVVFTDDTASLCGCGGIAYIGSFDDRVDEPVFVFNTSLTGIVEAATHEVGHAMLLAHDGQGTRTYYGGHGSGESSWGPIMGAAYNRQVTQWSAGDYFESTNNGADANYGNGPDDLSILSSLSNGNGFGYRDDDHGDTRATATNTTAGVVEGIISTTNDVDVFSISTGSTLSVAAQPHPANPNLDTSLTVLDSQGQIVAVSNDPTTLSSTLDLTGLEPGIHYITIDGVGWGSPLTSALTGWTGYGSLGEYTLTITADQGPVDTEAPAAPTGVSVTAVAETDVSLSWNPNTEADLAGYSVLRSDDGAEFVTVATMPAGETSFTDTGLVGATTYRYAVTARDVSGNVSPQSSTVIATTDTPTIQPDTAASETAVLGSVSGDLTATWADDGIAQTITEVSSGGKPRDRHDRAEHIWTFDATSGNHVLEIDSAVFDGGDADNGFELSWSTSATGPWSTLATLRPNASTGAYDLGPVSGSIHVRVIDTDRTARNRSFDSISVDLLRLTGGAPVTEAPAAVTGARPADGATGVATDGLLSWSPADRAASYSVTVSAGGVEVFSGSTTSTTIDAGELDPETTYQWRVDAVNEIGTTAGTSWSFTTSAAASTFSVTSLSEQSISASRGTRRAQATLTVLDDTGQPVSGASVTIRFSGGVSETVSGTTSGSGVVVLTSTGSAKKLSFSTCVVSLTAPGLTAAPSTFDC